MTPAEQFLYRSFRLLDNGELRGWLATCAGDIDYVVTTAENVRRGFDVALIRDNHHRLKGRIISIEKYWHAETPPTRTHHMVTNVECESWRPILCHRLESRMQPAHWNYSRIRPALQAAGRLIGTNLAERRNFVLRNPVEDNEFATTQTLVAAYQSILPGEHARSHRHSPHALRVILEARGAYSIVNGQKHPMETGDIVLTPDGCWHGHGHDGSEQAYWFDCLDVPLVQLLEPMTHDPHPQEWERDVVEVSASPYLIRWAEIQRRLAQLPDEGMHGNLPVGVKRPAPIAPLVGTGH